MLDVCLCLGCGVVGGVDGEGGDWVEGLTHGLEVGVVLYLGEL